MKLSHLLSFVSVLAIATAAHTAIAQTPRNAVEATAPAAPTYIPALTTSNAAPVQRSFPQTAPATVTVTKKPTPSRQACLSIRSYNYTADANNPQRSGTTTCTVANSNGVRNAIATR